MDFIFELICDIFFDSSVEIAKSSKNKKKAKIIITIIIMIPILIIAVPVGVFAIKTFNSDSVTGIILTGVDIFLLIIAITTIKTQFKEIDKKN